MSILDGLASTEDELKASVAMAAAAMQSFLAQAQLSSRHRDVIALLQEGLSLADIFDISKDHRDALLGQAIRLMQLGEPSKARELLIGLHQLEPLDERVIYALAATYQIEGDYSRAGKLMMYFLALDATNADGFLRLGECFMGNNELDEAVESFEAALDLVERGQASPEQGAHARTMLDMIAARGGPVSKGPVSKGAAPKGLAISEVLSAWGASVPPETEMNGPAAGGSGTGGSRLHQTK